MLAGFGIVWNALMKEGTYWKWWTVMNPTVPHHIWPFAWCNFLKPILAITQREPSGKWKLLTISLEDAEIPFDPNTSWELCHCNVWPRPTLSFSSSLWQHPAETVIALSMLRKDSLIFKSDRHKLLTSFPVICLPQRHHLWYHKWILGINCCLAMLTSKGTWT